MKWLKYIYHPHSYIVFFVLISVLAFIPNGLGWRHTMLGYTTEYFWLYVFYIFFYFLGYSTSKSKVEFSAKEISLKTINLFHIIYFICALFFILKFVYIGGTPMFADSGHMRIRLAKLGGFVDFPTKAISLLGIVAYYFYLTRNNSLYLVQFIISIALNILFAERSPIVFTILGAVILYVKHREISVKTFRKVVFSSMLLLFLIGWIQIRRHGGKDHLNKTKTMSTAEVVGWVIHGDLTGSQKFGAYTVNELDGQKLYGKYTFGIYLSLFIPNYKDHGATYLQKEFNPKARTAQSAAIPYSYYMDFGYFSLMLPFIIGYMSKKLYLKFRDSASLFYKILYIAFFFNLLWSVRAGNFPVDPKLVYFVLVMIFIFNPQSKVKINNQIIQLIRLLFLATLVLSVLALIIRW
ncbi:O-antigen polymerase [Psychroserpens ponticola]|uniref:O-antigen ligase n=1 Tax=Psychroserpens ponticola TaxID=2932268 RepID=A0ABY7RX39_9FLAO|nr:O-antigen polymerase [Psychroserpens ponticola]WCO01642.1 O-antigen ligase [Psychroserpens ponticola]